MYNAMFPTHNSRHMGNIENIEQIMRKIEITQNSRVIISISTLCTKITKASFHKRDEDYLGLHVATSNLIWKAASAVEEILKGTDGSRVAITQEMDEAYSDEMEEELDDLFGKAWTARWGGTKYQGHVMAPRTRRFRMDPGQIEQDQQLNTFPNEVNFEDGYCWLTEEHPPGSIKIQTVRTCIPGLIKRALQNEKGVQGGYSRDRSLRSFRVQNRWDRKDRRWMKPRHMAQLMGFDEETIQIMSATHPCKGEIDGRLGKTRGDWVAGGAKELMQTETFGLSSDVSLFSIRNLCQNHTNFWR